MSKDKQFYAIHFLQSNTDRIVCSWDECKKLVYRVPCKYKKFYSRDEAVVWLNSLQEETARKELSKKQFNEWLKQEQLVQDLMKKRKGWEYKYF